jgi:hypothetical protein
MARVQSALNGAVTTVMVVAALMLGTADVPAYGGHVRDWHATPAQFQR